MSPKLCPTTAARGDPAARLRARKRISRPTPKCAQFPIIPCDLCGSQDNLQRKQVKRCCASGKSAFPGRVETIFRSLQRVDALAPDGPPLFDFAAVAATGMPAEDGDKAFDAEEIFDLAAPR